VRASEHRLGPRETCGLGDGAILLERDLGIVVRDRVRLSADVYRPNRPGRFPAILEHLPYRKDDTRAATDRANGTFLAEHGLVLVRLDVRGTGNSGGIASDEYTIDEQLDGVDAVAWIASRDWSNGNVGSWGVSYGGFSSIQLACHRPPALKAIAAIYATDDRYTDDMHFAGGGLCALELAHYPLRILAMNALPPAPEPGEPGEVFTERWLDRVRATPPWILRWLDEQHDGPYWRNGSARPGYDRIECPALLVAGWRDGYRTAMLRLAKELSAPWQLLAGPWMHTTPDAGIPGPRYPFLDEVVRWFRRHLELSARTEPAPERPRTVFFLNGYDPPAAPPAEVSGAWMGSDRWPEGVVETVRYLTVAGGLATEPDPEFAVVVCPFDPSVGEMSGNWCPPPPGHGLPFDQRPDEARSAVFTSAPLHEPVDILGMPRVRLRVKHPGPGAIVAVKLADVAPDGSSQLVTRGSLSLAHRDGSTGPSPFVGVGDVEIELQATGWRFEEGHRIRLAVAGSDWPTVWPLPTTDPVALHVGGDSRAMLRLPGLPADARPYEPSGAVFGGRRTAGFVALPARSTWRAVADGIAATSGIEASDEDRFEHPEEGLRVEEARSYHAFVNSANPLDAKAGGRATFRVKTARSDVRTTATGEFGCTADVFTYDLRLVVREGGRVLHRDRWRGSVARRLC
jgi:putative CocE/NonD family hydrolase